MFSTFGKLINTIKLNDYKYSNYIDILIGKLFVFLIIMTPLLELARNEVNSTKKELIKIEFD